MSPNTHLSLFFLSLFLSISLPVLSSPYISPLTFIPNYQKMLKSFKIFSYTPPQPLVFSTPAESLFFSSLLNSSFLTPDPDRAHLFFVPFSSATPTRSLSRLVNELRTDFPYWNRTLGADHFYVSCDGLGFNSDRNLVELKKNSVQISCFPTQRSSFIPHKDITLPPLADPHHAPVKNESKNYLGYVKYGAVKESSLVNELSDDQDFLVERQPSDVLTYEWRLSVSKFCLFEYGDGDVSGISDAVSFGCVPVVITDRPIQDMPLMDVLRWQEIAVFVGWKNKSGGGSDGAKQLRHVLGRTYGDEKRYEEVRGSCVTAGQHLVWNEEPQPFDAFHMTMYQLWLRRHTIRYARTEVA
ncbi:hypothetical protein Dsin_003233 [Dipteronia sinensis]|uniref:Exostosin GT47 domain-containing protein n=1 Tax=Dipteronia sinensis TaxID=43782 RepID=A0AAE0EKR0_9ROSI|nr:hypothetical protein Dsin_003233 [Dipteronia sinensis]